jgi:glycosyltransferase involved in cell wall biosynthesis
VAQRKNTLLLVAGFADSVLPFRGDLLRCFLARGYAVHVAAPGLATGSAIARSLEAEGIVPHDIPLRRTGLNPLNDLAALLALFALMRRIAPRLTLAYTIKPVIYGSLAARAARVPRRYALITGLGYAFQTGSSPGLLQSLAQRLYRTALAGVHTVFFQNPDDEALFKTRRVVSAAVPTCVINGSGIDVDHFAPCPLPPGPPVFLMIARLLADKGVREFAQAARQVKARHPDARFVLVGWIDANPSAITAAELQTWIDEGSVEFAGRLDDVRPILAQASVFVLPSYREGTPRTVLEAMAMGRAIITTDAPGCRETVTHGVNGLLVPIKDADALAATMSTLVEDAPMLARMAAASRRIAEDKYDVRRVNAHMLRKMEIV